MRPLAKSWTALRFRDLQIVGHRENAWDPVGPHPCEILVAFTVDDALQGHAAILDDDANGLLHTEFILLQRRILVNRLEELQAKAILHGRRGKNFDLIVDLLHAFNTLHHILRVGLEAGAYDLTEQGDGGTRYFIRDVVKDAEVGKHQKLVADLFDNPLLRLSRKLSVLRCTEGRECEQTSEQDQKLVFHGVISLSNVVPWVTTAKSTPGEGRFTIQGMWYCG